MEQNAAKTDLCRSETGLLYGYSMAHVKNNIDRLVDLSLEFLMGRALDNAMLNVGLKDVAQGT